MTAPVVHPPATTSDLADAIADRAHAAGVPVLSARPGHLSRDHDMYDWQTLGIPEPAPDCVRIVVDTADAGQLAAAWGLPEPRIRPNRHRRPSEWAGRLHDAHVESAGLPRWQYTSTAIVHEDVDVTRSVVHGDPAVGSTLTTPVPDGTPMWRHRGVGVEVRVPLPAARRIADPTALPPADRVPWRHRTAVWAAAVLTALVLLLALVPVWLIVATVSGGVIVAALGYTYRHYLIALAAVAAVLALVGVFFAALGEGLTR